MASRNQQGVKPGARRELEPWVVKGWAGGAVAAAVCCALLLLWLSQCGDPFKDESLVVLNGTKEEVDKLREKMEEKRAKAKATKKSKKNKVAETVAKPSDSKENPESTETVSSEGQTSTQNGGDNSQPVPEPPASSSTKVVTPSAATGSKRSIQTMEEKSETYKSLFTSHSSAKRTKDQMSNWVTHTPYHF